MSGGTIQGERAGASAYVAIGALAGAVMAFELSLVRIFSFTIWHHFAFMVISVALLGFGVSGVLLSLWPGLASDPRRRAALWSACFGLSAVLATAATAPLPIDSVRIGADLSQLGYLAALYLAFTLPFCFAGLAVVTLLRGFAPQVGRLYAADLLGAGVCSLLSVLLMRPLGADGLVLASTALAMLAAVLLTLGERARKTAALTTYAALGLVAVALVPKADAILVLKAGHSKGLAGVLRTFPKARITHSEWSPIGRVDAVEDGGGVVWTSNPKAGTRSPAQAMLVIDGDAATPIIPWDGDVKSPRFLDFTLSSAALQLMHPTRTLVLGSGGGVDVLTALHHGAKHVDAVEINGVVRELVRGPYASLGGRLFYRPEVTLHADEGRSFIRRSEQRWDAIQLSLIDTWAASSSGAYALTEGYLYTVEAFTDYLSHLEPNGVLTLTRWETEIPRDSLKLIVEAHDALLALGAQDPRQHIVLVGLANLANMIVKREPFTAEELARLRQIAAARGFHLIFAPDTPSSSAFAAFFAARDPLAFIDAYPYDVSSATDDAPFFFQFGRWRNLLSSPIDDDIAGTASGRGVLLAVLGQALLATLLLLVAPLLRRGQRPRAREGSTLGVIAFFFLIGMAFMLVEISLMQRFTLYLGQPVLAVAFVLAVLLFSAGLGSALSRRVAHVPALMLLCLCGAIAVYALGLPTLFEATLGLTLPTRLALGAALLMPLGVLLGMPLPLAVARLTDQGEEDLVAWGWAANGCASVLGPIVASLLAFDVGFARVTLCAAMLYGLSYLSFASRFRTPAEA